MVSRGDGECCQLPVSPMSIFNTNAARADERFSVGVKCRSQPVADGKPAVFFYLFCLHLKNRISTIRLVSDRWVKPETIGDL